MTTEEVTYKLGDRVRSTSDALGVLDPDSPRTVFLADVTVPTGHGGEIVAPSGSMPDGWLLVSFDELGLAPVHPSMIRPEQTP